jgi:multimeric flavodoxin WrbA
MRVLAINGSPRKKGNTATLLGQVLDAAAAKGAETRMIHLNDLDMKGCQGCLVCRENMGECAVKDDFQDVLEEIKTSDAIAFGTPIYVFNVSGQFKCFLDRCFCLVDSPEDGMSYKTGLPAGRKFVLVTSQGDEDPEAYRHIIEYLRTIFSFLGGTVEVITQTGSQDRDSARNDGTLLSSADRAGNWLVS